MIGLPLVGSAGKHEPKLWSGEPIARAEKGSIVVGKQHVRLTNRATPRETVMISVSNDNQQFAFWVVLPKQRERDYQYIELDGEWWSSNGTGYDHEGTKTTFHFDRATARRIAGAFGVPLLERTRLDTDLKYTWRFPAKATTRADSPIPVVLRVENSGKTTVGLSIGGRQRGPRDNRFAFTIARNGKPVAIKEAHDFGGIMTYQEIEPGEHADVTCADLRAWATLDVPGYYTIEATYQGELVKDGKTPRTAAERANEWDIAPTGQGSILVQ